MGRLLDLSVGITRNRKENVAPGPPFRVAQRRLDTNPPHLGDVSETARSTIRGGNGQSEVIDTFIQ